MLDIKDLLVNSIQFFVCLEYQVYTLKAKMIYSIRVLYTATPMAVFPS